MPISSNVPKATEGTFSNTINLIKEDALMLKFKNQRKLTTLGLVFALMLIAGVVYAAVSGTLTFNGTVILGGGEFGLKIVELDGSHLITNGEIEVDVAADGQSATFTVTLEGPGDYADIWFEIQNTGSLDFDVASVGGVPISVTASGTGDTDAIITGLTFPAMGDTIYAGTAEDAVFSVEWDDAYPDEADVYTFTVTLDYEQAP
jgi:hypothetical protein